MKEFTEKDVNTGGGSPRIYLDHEDLVDAPLWWHKQGRQQTATGYGRRLTTGYKVNYCGRLYRIYATCFSNAASLWFVAKKRTIYVS